MPDPQQKIVKVDNHLIAFPGDLPDEHVSGLIRSFREAKRQSAPVTEESEHIRQLKQAQPLPTLPSWATTPRLLNEVGAALWPKQPLPPDIEEANRRAAERVKQFDVQHPVAAGAIQGATNVIDSLRNPLSIGLMIAAPESKLLSGIFAMQAAQGAFRSAQDARDAYKASKNPEAFRQLLRWTSGQVVPEDEFNKAWAQHLLKLKFQMGQKAAEATADLGIAGVTGTHAVKGTAVNPEGLRSAGQGTIEGEGKPVPVEEIPRPAPQIVPARPLTLPEIQRVRIQAEALNPVRNGKSVIPKLLPTVPRAKSAEVPRGTIALVPRPESGQIKQSAYGTPEPEEIPLQMKDGTPFMLRRRFQGKYDAIDVSTGQPIGEFSYGQYPDKTWKMFGVKVDPSYQRRGIATAGYNAIEKLIGAKFKDTGSQSDIGRAFWASREAIEANQKKTKETTGRDITPEQSKTDIENNIKQREQTMEFLYSTNPDIAKDYAQRDPGAKDIIERIIAKHASKGGSDALTTGNSGVAGRGPEPESGGAEGRVRDAEAGRAKEPAATDQRAVQAQDELKISLAENDFQDLVHGTTPENAQSIRKTGAFDLTKGQRQYDYSEFGPDAIYLGQKGGPWVDKERVADMRGVPYDASVEARLSPDARILHLNNFYDVDNLAAALGIKPMTAQESPNHRAKTAVQVMMDELFIDGLNQGVYSRKEGDKDFDASRALANRIVALGVDALSIPRHIESEGKTHNLPTGEQVVVLNPSKIELLPEKPTKYKYGNTQADVPQSSDAGKALLEARGSIDKSDLAGKGIEDDPHITVRYGIDAEDTEGIRKYLESQPPFEATLGPVTAFPVSEHSEGAAPIVVSVESPDLHKMEKEIDAHGNFVERSFPDYKPHVTLAYVKPEAADKYIGMAGLEGKKFTINSVSISKKDGSTESVPLLGKPKERRVDTAKRKRIADMSAEEMRKILLTSDVVDLPNRRSFDEAQHDHPAKFVARSDADGLKAFNDKFGYEMGNALLKAKAEALKQAGLDAYHEKGDEFLYRGESEDDLKARLEKAREILRNTVFDVTLEDGTKLTLKGVDFSYGTGKDLREAEQQQHAHKEEREQRGERARGELRGITETRTGPN